MRQTEGEKKTEKERGIATVKNTETEKRHETGRETKGQAVTS